LAFWTSNPFIMKKLYLLTVMVIVSPLLYAQDQIVYKVVSVLPNQNFYLNSGTRARLGSGKSRVFLEVVLPANTVEWYYAFTTTPNNNQSQSIGLASTLSKLLDPTHGIATAALNAIVAPKGSGACDIYVVDNINILNQFVSMATEKPVRYNMEGSRENLLQGVAPVHSLSDGKCYLAIRNPSYSIAVNVNIEITAIVAEKQIIAVVPDIQKAELYGSLGYKAYQNGEYDKGMEFSSKALTINNELIEPHLTIALIYLVTNNTETTDEYIKVIEMVKKSSHPKENLARAIKDIDDAIANKKKNKDIDLIHSLLTDEYKKYSTASR
jgi:hypothetical protein